MDSFGKHKYWSTSRRYSPYEVSQCPATYSGLESQDVLKTFQDSYERLRTDANTVLPQKKTCSSDALEMSYGKKVMETHTNVGESSSYSRDNNSLSYIGMIATAILRSPEVKLTLAGIYTYMEKHFYSILSNRPGWRNTVRHNLSLHDCFVKGEIAAEGKGRFWRIHPNYFEQFECGKFNKNILQNSVPMFYRNLGNVRLSSSRPELTLTPSCYPGSSPGSSWPPTFYPMISPSFLYPALTLPQVKPLQPPKEDLNRFRTFRTCANECFFGCQGVRQLPAIQCSSYSHPPQTRSMEKTLRSSSAVENTIH